MKPLTRFTFIILCCQTLALVGVSAQENDNQEHWSFLENKAISNDANWLAYILNYPELETDTLFVIATSSDKRFKIPQSKMGMFSEDSQWFVGRGFPNNYHFINLVSNRQFFRDAVTEVYFSPNNGSMLLYHPEQNRLHSTGNHPVEDVCLEMITDLAFHNTTGKLALVQQQKDGL